MSWEEVALWLEKLKVSPDAVDRQLKEQSTGEEIQGYIETSSSDKEAIQKVMNMFAVKRQDAVRIMMNMRLREQKHNRIGKQERSVNDVILEVIQILQSMREQGFGRYHGSHTFAQKFAWNRGIDVLLKHVKEGEEQICFNALWALTLIGDSAEERPTESSDTEAFSRFEKRKLMIKAGGVATLMEVLTSRPEDSKELALHLLRSLLVYPSHWIGWNGEKMSQFFSSPSAVLLGSGMPLLLDLVDAASSHSLRKLALSIILELMLADDDRAQRHCSAVLGSKFFRDPKPRSRANTASSDQSMGVLRNNMLLRSHADDAAAAQRKRNAHDLEIPEEGEGEGDEEGGPSPARRAVLEAGGLAVLTRIIAAPAVPGRLKISNLSAKALPRADRSGESDPYLRIFLGDKEQRTEIKMDTSRPVWEETLWFDVDDVASASLIILVFDYDEHDSHDFMCMAHLHLAELAAAAEEGGQIRTMADISESDLLSKISRGERSAPVRHGHVIAFDDWLELHNRNGSPPTLRGVLGALHCTLSLETVFAVDPPALELQGDALGALHVILSDPAARPLARRDILLPALKTLQGPSPTAQAKAASVLCDLTSDLHLAHALIDAGGVEALLQASDFGSKHTQLRATEALATLATEPSCRARLLDVKGHLGAGADGIRPLVQLLEEEDGEEGEGAGRGGGEVAAGAATVLCNLCVGDERAQGRVLESAAPASLVRRLGREGGAGRAEMACLLALLAENPDGRRYLASVVGRSGEGSLSTVGALSRALSTRDHVTDATARAGAANARAASVAGLSLLSQYGGLEELVRVMRGGDQGVQTEAAAALAEISAEEEQRGAVVATGVVPLLVEMLILATSPPSRFNAGLALARVSLKGEDEKPREVLARVREVSAYIPRLGVSPIDPMVNLLLRSIHEDQRAVAAQALASWAMDKANAEQAWTIGGELIVDLLMVDYGVNPQGIWYAVQAVLAICEHVTLREHVARSEYAVDGSHRSVMKAFRAVLRCEDRETVMEAALVLQLLHPYGGLEELVAVLVGEDGSGPALKAVATVIQPLCSKPPTRKRIVALSGRASDELSMWMSKYIYEG